MLNPLGSKEQKTKKLQNHGADNKHCHSANFFPHNGLLLYKHNHMYIVAYFFRKINIISQIPTHITTEFILIQRIADFFIKSYNF